jgi:hypothetical protein
MAAIFATQISTQNLCSRIEIVLERRATRPASGLVSLPNPRATAFSECHPMNGENRGTCTPSRNAADAGPKSKTLVVARNDEGVFLVADEWSAIVPIERREIDVLETSLAAFFDEMFGGADARR